MTTPDQVTSFVAHYTLAVGNDWNHHRENWQQVALEAWLDAAQQHGLDVTVQQMCADSNQDVAVVEVAGEQYTVTHFSRRPEVQAEQR